MKTKPKLSDFNKPHIKNAVKVYIMAKAYAQLMREESEREIYQPALFIDGKPIYQTADEWTEKTGGEKRYITKHKDSYLMNDTDAEDYFSECNHQIEKRAINDKRYRVKKDHCPALVAEELERQGARAVIIAVEPLTGINFDDLICSGLDNYRKYLDLNCRLIVSQFPEYFKDLERSA